MLIVEAVLTADQIVSQRKDRSMMAYLEIEKVVVREILDSRGNQIGRASCRERV